MESDKTKQAVERDGDRRIRVWKSGPNVNLNRLIGDLAMHVSELRM